MKKKLYRDTSNQMLSGVCSGIAKYFDVDVTLIRLAWVFVSLVLSVGVGGLIAYIVCAIVIPSEPPADYNNYQGDGTYYQPPQQ